MVTRAGPVEVCPHCEGLWLDAGATRGWRA
ncbi:zf-TFIIB domain-containing protein [Cystobacter fuscus]